MQTPPASLPNLYKTAGQKCALRNLGLISQEEFEKEAWIPAAIGVASAVLPSLWRGVKGIFSRGGKAVAGTAQRGSQAAQQGGANMLQRGRQFAQGMRPPV